MQVRYTNTQQDLVAGARALPAEIRRSNAIMAWLFFAVWFIPLGWYLPHARWYAVAGTLLFPTYILIKIRRLRGIVPAFVEIFSRPHEVTLAPDAVRLAREGAATRWSWSCVRAVTRTAEHVVIVLRPQSFFVIPLHAFASPAEADSLADEAERLRAAASQSPLAPSAAGEAIRRNAVARVSYTLTARQAAAISLVRADTATKQRSGGVRSVAVLVAITCNVYAALAGGMVDTGTVAGQLIEGLLSSLIALLLALLAYRAMHKRFAQRQYEPRDLGPIEVCLAPEALVTSTPQTESVVAWSQIAVFQDEPQYLKFLLPAGVISQCIPRSVFESETAAAHFIATARRFQSQAYTEPPAPPLTVPIVETGNPYQPPAS